MDIHIIRKEHGCKWISRELMDKKKGYISYPKNNKLIKFREEYELMFRKRPLVQHFFSRIISFNYAIYHIFMILFLRKAANQYILISQNKLTFFLNSFI